MPSIISAPADDTNREPLENSHGLNHDAKAESKNDSPPASPTQVVGKSDVVEAKGDAAAEKKGGDGTPAEGNKNENDTHKDVVSKGPKQDDSNSPVGGADDKKKPSKGTDMMDGKYDGENNTESEGKTDGDKTASKTQVEKVDEIDDKKDSGNASDKENSDNKGDESIEVSAGEKRKGEGSPDGSGEPSAKKSKTDDNHATGAAAAMDSTNGQQQQAQAAQMMAIQQMAVQQQFMQMQQMAAHQQMQMAAHAQQQQINQQHQLYWRQQMNLMQEPLNLANNNKNSHVEALGYNFHKVVLTLPPSNRKLGLLLDDNHHFGLPELKCVADTSPILKQLPKQFHKDICIASMKSEAIGHVQPKSAQHCATLISKAQESKVQPRTMEIVVIRTKDAPQTMQEPLEIPKKAKGKNPYDGVLVEGYPAKVKPSSSKGRKRDGPEKLEHDIAKKRALLDFFSDSSKPPYATFFRESKHDESLRTGFGRVINGNPRLKWLVGMRDKAEYRQEACELIDRLLPYDIVDKTDHELMKKKKWLLEFFGVAPQKKSPFQLVRLGVFAKTKKIENKMLNDLRKTIQKDETLCGLVNKETIDASDIEMARDIINKIVKDPSAKALSEKAKFDREKKEALLDFFSDSSGKTIDQFCNQNAYDAKLRSTIKRYIDNDKRLTEIVDKRDDPARRERAFNVIEELLSGITTKYSTGINSNKDGDGTTMNTTTHYASGVPKSHRTMATEFFTPANIKEIAAQLNLDARPRMTRDGSKEIMVHDRRVPDELLMLLIFDLNNRACRGRALSLRERNAVMAASAKILFYDHGYKAVVGVSNLEKGWEQRLENAYMTGAEQRPLDRLYQGKSSYTDNIEKDHPGLLAQIYAHTEEMIGKEAPVREKAMFMNEKSMEDHYDDPTKPVLEMNQSRLTAWAKQQKLGRGGADPGDESSAPQRNPDSDLSLDKLDKKYPGIVEDLYNFALEAMGADASYHILATCMNERAKENVEEDPTLPLVTVTKLTLPGWVKKKGF